MSDNIIDLQRFRLAKPDQEEQRHLIRSRNILRLRRIEESRDWGKKGPIFLKIEDRIRAGRATGALIKEAKTRGITAKMIADKFDHFHRYAVLDDRVQSDAVARDKAGRTLMQQVRGYLRLAAVVAEMLEKDPDDAKIAVLSSTNLWNRAERTDENHGDEHEAADELAFLIREMAQHVIRRTGLSDLLGRARRIPGVWDPTAYRFKPSDWPSLYQPAYLEYLAADDEIPPLPGVPLVRLLHAEIEVPLVIEVEGVVDPGSEEETATKWVFEGEELWAQVRVYREIRLVLGPTTSPDAIGPMFETRSHLELLIDDPEDAAQSDLFCPVYETHADFCCLERGVHILFRGMWRRVQFKGPVYPAAEDDIVEQVLAGGSVKHPLFWDHSPLAEKKNCFETYYVSWTPVDDLHVRHWLERSDLEPNLISTVPPRGDKPLPEATWFFARSMAHEVEVALATASLESALIADVERVCESLDQRERSWRDALMRTKGSLIARWNVPDEPGV